MFVIEGKYASVKVFADMVDQGCVASLTRAVNHPAFTNPIAAMPDAHDGAGCVIGFTMRMTGKMIPNVIGVDIGCGMRMAVFPADRYDRPAVDDAIRRAVPFGSGSQDSPDAGTRAASVDVGKLDWDTLRRDARETLPAFSGVIGYEVSAPDYSPEWFSSLCRRVGGNEERHLRSIGTLGGGNHFIETGISPDGKRMALTVHTGSRHLGGRIARFWQGKATKRDDGYEMERAELLSQVKSGLVSGKSIEAGFRKLAAKTGKVPKDMGWLSSKDAAGYLVDMFFAQRYAAWNRDAIMSDCLAVLGAVPEKVVETVHNYVDYRDMTIRKGAIRSYAGEEMVIPFNMEDGVLLCEGKSNPEWNFSAPHGAGRVMARGVAGATLDGAAMIRDMEDKDIYCVGAGPGLVDESRGAYKPADMVEKAIAPTAEVVDRFIPYHSMKAL